MSMQVKKILGLYSGMKNKIFLGITPGDPNGIGMELILKSFDNPLIFNHCLPVLYANPELIRHYANLLGMDHFQYKVISSTKEFEPGKLNLKNIHAEAFDFQPGKPDQKAGNYALKALNAAIEDIKNGEIHNLLTGPIDKNTTYSKEFEFAGHTEFLANTFETERFMMLLVSEDLKVGLVTGHIPIQQVAGALKTEKILEKLSILNESLIQDFGISNPKIAVLGLNPHSGDNGVIGKEEIEIIMPAIEEARKTDILALGPYPADGFFGNGLYKKFDAVLAMYHDQGLIPFKQMAFSSGVNYTAGLPAVRTSPDHGTAYDIAGKGVANAESFINAIFLNNEIYKKRVEFMELTKNPLAFTKHRREKFSIGIPVLK
jgi:4-hydroxythreonine-4-phosphate dehydrogenase